MSDVGGYNVRNPEIEEQLKSLASHIKEGCPEGWGFALFLFEFGPNGSLFYIADAERSDIIRVMKEFITRNTQ